MSDIGTIVDRAGWATRRGRRNSSARRWTRAEIAQLRDLVGKENLSAIARTLGRSRNAVAGKLMALGYRIKADVQAQIGLNCRELAERTGAAYEQVWRDCRAGEIPGAFKEAGRDYMIPWRSVRAYERRLGRIRAARERVLGRIQVETITKQQAMALIGLSETQMTRYLQGKVIRAWKVPLMWVPGNRQRWEWAVSKPDAERVRHLRATGKLHVRLRKRAFREISDQCNEEVKRIKRERRAGVRTATMKPHGPGAQAVVPGHLTIPQVAQRVGLSATAVYGHAASGRLAATSVRVGRRSFLAVSPEACADYEAWCARPVKATGPMQAWRKRVDQVHAKGLITTKEAAERYDLVAGTLVCAARDGRLKARRCGALLAFRPADVEAFKAGMRRRGQPK